MKHTILKLSLVLLAFSAFADEPEFDSQGTWWINLGLGYGGLMSHTVSGNGADNTDAIQFGAASFNYAVRDNQYIALRTTYTGQFLDVKRCVTCDEGIDSITEVGILYGLMKKTKSYTIGGAAGLAYVSLDYLKGEYVYVPDGNYYTTEHTSRRSQTIGLPLEAQFFLTPFDYVGFGLIGTANLNTEGSLAGIMLAIQFGQLR